MESQWKITDGRTPPSALPYPTHPVAGFRRNLSLLAPRKLPTDPASPAYSTKPAVGAWDGQERVQVPPDPPYLDVVYTIRDNSIAFHYHYPHHTNISTYRTIFKNLVQVNRQLGYTARALLFVVHTR